MKEWVGRRGKTGGAQGMQKENRVCVATVDEVDETREGLADEQDPGLLYATNGALPGSCGYHPMA